MAPTGGRKRGMLLGVGGLVLALLVVVVVVGRRGGDALSVALEALDAHPEGSFTASVVKLPNVQANVFASKVHRSGSKDAATDFTARKVAGDRSGLYGVWAGKPVCDVPRLVRLVTADRSIRATWAGAMGVAPGRVDATLEASTPVVLGRDTAVTETFTHGGGTVTRQVVLQAGTAVLVDTTAAPIVRCASGDPLSPSKITASAPHLTGSRWDGFDPGSVIDVSPASEPVGSIHAVDILTGRPVEITLGGTGSPTQSGTTTLPPPTTPPATTSITTTTTVRSTTTTPPALTAPTWDEIKNASLPSVCGHPPTTLVDGKNVDLTGDLANPPADLRLLGVYQLDHMIGDWTGSPNGRSGLVSGLRSEVGPLTAVVVSCNGGGMAFPNEIAAFGPGGRFYDEGGMGVPSQWQALGEYQPGREGVTQIELSGGKLVVHTTVQAPGDPVCCPSAHARIVVSASGGKLHSESVQLEAG